MNDTDKPWNSSATMLVKHQGHRLAVADCEWCPVVEPETEAPDDPTALDVLAELKDRCERAAADLDGMATEDRSGPHATSRLLAKRDGVKLALSYIDEAIRGLS